MTKVFGEKNGRAKLTEMDVLEIRRLYSERIMTQGQIAEKYDLYQPYVSRIITKFYWSHI